MTDAERLALLKDLAKEAEAEGNWFALRWLNKKIGEPRG